MQMNELSLGLLCKDALMSHSPASKIFASSHELTPSYQRKVGIVIAVSAIIALLLSNIFPEKYESVLHANSFLFGMDWSKFIDKGIMSVFFFAAGMEIRHEFFHGHLTKPEARRLPLLCAVGGVVGPLTMMLAFGTTFSLLSVDGSGDVFRAFPIPIATDIVFALAFLSFFSSRIPRSLRAFVLAFAVIDDLIGLLMLFILQGSISPTAVAVVLGFAIPANFHTYQVRAHLLAKLLLFNSFFVLPLFALANTGISLHGIQFEKIIAEPLLWSIVLAQFFGKIFGIYGVTMIVRKSSKLSFPRGCDDRHMLVAASVAAIGFTLSLFLAKAAFSSPDQAPTLLVAKLAIAVASLIAMAFSIYVTRKLPEDEPITSTS